MLHVRDGNRWYLYTCIRREHPRREGNVVPELVPDVCRKCGFEGLADSELDPAPGICPACLNKGMAALMPRVLLVAANLGPASVEKMLRRGLHDIGLTDRFIEAFVTGDAKVAERAIRKVERRWHSD